MFEIIMLFAFFCAATSQLFPDRPANSKTPRNTHKRHDRAKAVFLLRPAQKSRKTPAISLKAKSRYCDYVRAA